MVCDQFGVPAAALHTKSREMRISWPRQVAIFFMRELCVKMDPEIAAFYDLNRTAVGHSVVRVKETMEAYPKVAAAVEAIRQELLSPPPKPRE